MCSWMRDYSVVRRLMCLAQVGKTKERIPEWTSLSKNIRAVSRVASFSDWSMLCETTFIMIFPAGSHLERNSLLCYFFLNKKIFQGVHCIIMTLEFLLQMITVAIFDDANGKMEENINKLGYPLPRGINILV